MLKEDLNKFDSVAEAFSLQSATFDSYEEENDILKWMRAVTRKHVMRHLKINDEILELNSGTGLDAVYFAEAGFKIFCTDIAEGMLNKLDEKVKQRQLQSLVTLKLLSFTELDQLEPLSFDYIFSNFGGLNCERDLKNVFRNFHKILKQGGKATLVIIPPVCPWEIALIFTGKFKTAFRRFSKNGVLANVEGVKFQTYYHSVSKTLKALGPEFKILELEGLASFSPPPYMINFPKRLPRLYRFLTGIDKKLSHHFPFNRWADHFILTVQYEPGKK